MASPQTVPGWRHVLTLDESRVITEGSPQGLRDALQRGADLRIYSEFRHNEHIDTASSSSELIRETMDMRTTYVIDGRWGAGISTLRQPVQLPDGFGPRPSLSLFLYNEDGGQAIARPYLDGMVQQGPLGLSPPGDHRAMPRYHELDAWDAQTNAPCSNFVYDFDTIRYFVREDWRPVLHHAADGTVISGSRDELNDLFRQGAEWKVGVRGLCADLGPAGEQVLPHEVFIQAGACYLYTEQRLLIAASHPLVRVRPAVPLKYASRNWDYAWLVARTDGQVARLVYDPYTLQTSRAVGQYEMHWFCR